MPLPPRRLLWPRAGLACGLLLGTTGCADLLGTAISSAPNRWIPWQKTASRTHPGVRRVLGIDQEFRVDVGTPDEPLELLVQIVDPADAAPPHGTVLVLHGVVSSGRAMLPHARRLAQQGYRAVLVDLRGHGKSDGQYLTYGVRESDDLMRVIDALESRRLTAGRLGVLGVSYGATTAIHLAGKDSRIDSVVAVAPFSTMRDVVPDFGRTVLPGVGSLVSDQALDAGVDEAVRQGDFDPNLADACAAIQKTQARVLVIHGEEDWMVPTYHGKRLHEAAPDHSQLVLLPWTGHLAAWLDPFGQVGEETHRWFDSHLASTPTRPSAED
ncbi:MAG: alpha/beta hydrolase [Planctomycetaceae bacterium]